MLNLRTGEHFRDCTKTMTRRDALKGLAGIGAILASGSAPAILRHNLEMRTVAMTGGGELPSGYEAIEYVTDSDWVAINFGNWSTGDSITLHFKIYIPSNSNMIMFQTNISGYQPWFGIYNKNLYSNSGGWVKVDGDTLKPSVGIYDSTYKFINQRTGQTNLMFIHIRKGVGSYYASGYKYYFFERINPDGTKPYRYIPAKRLSDGKNGLYEVVGKTFTPYGS